MLAYLMTAASILTLTIAALSSCSDRLTSQPQQSIYLFKDKDGLYRYNPVASREEVIYKATNGQIFLDEPYQISGDTLTFGLKGQLVFGKISGESWDERYTKDYVSTDLKTGKSWLSKKVVYEVIDHSTLHVKTMRVGIDGSSIAVSDTSMACHGWSSTFKGIIYNSAPRFFSKHSLAGKSVFSLRGSIYYTEGTDTTLLVEYKGEFDPKFGSGYFQPCFDPTGQYVVFRYLPGLFHGNKKASLQRVDIQTKKTEIIKNGDFGGCIFSADGNFLLFARGQKKGKSDTWTSGIYLMEMATLKEQKIGNAYSAQWAQ